MNTEQTKNLLLHFSRLGGTFFSMNPRVVGFLSLLVTSIALPPLWSAPVTIGMAEEVNEYVRAESTEGEKRQIRKDAPLYFGDKVTTDFEAYLKIRLLDDTTFTLGPRTTVTLDEFVYDPDTSQGKMTASVARGVFRFVTRKF
jgi:trimeric autotransporter adhesin